MKTNLELEFENWRKKALNINFPEDYSRLRRLFWESIAFKMLFKSYKSIHIFIDSLQDIYKSEKNSIIQWVNKLILEYAEKTDQKISSVYKIKIMIDNFSTFNDVNGQTINKFLVEQSRINFNKKFRKFLEEIKKQLNYDFNIINIYYSYNDYDELTAIQILIDENYLNEATHFGGRYAKIES